jgi:nucleoside-diphosphate-sugar epimerase
MPSYSVHMKILIVGGTGLISTAITRQLLDRGDEVIHYNRGQSESRVGVEVPAIIGDRKNFASFEAQIRDVSRFDCVIDMICYTPDEAESLVRACRGRTDHVIFCSTVDVFNKPAIRYPIPDDAPLGGVSAYGKDKARCEQILLAAHRRGDLRLTILRPAQTYGEGRVPIHVFGAGAGVMKRLRQGKPVIVHGDGSSLWVACHIDDVAGAFLGATGNERAMGKAYNITGEEWMTWDQFTEMEAEALGAPPPQIVHIPSDLLFKVVPEKAKIIHENFRFNNIFDTSAARRDLGFQYTIPFVPGTRRAVEWADRRGLIAQHDGDPWQDRVIDVWHRLGNAMAMELP